MAAFFLYNLQHTACKAVHYSTQSKEICKEGPPQKDISLYPSPQNLLSLPPGCSSFSCSLTQIFEIPLMHNRLNMTEREAKITETGRRRERQEQTQLSKDLNASPKGVDCTLKVSASCILKAH